MKCVKNGEEIRKVKDENAVKLVKEGWNYCPKHEWKKKVRGEVKVEVVDKPKKTYKSKKSKVKNDIVDELISKP